MSESLLQQITEETGLPADAYYCNHKVKLMLDPGSKQIIVDFGNFVKKKRPYWVEILESDVKDPAFQSIEEHKNGRWISEIERSLANG